MSALEAEIPRDEFADMLERNGFPGAAEEVHAGKSYAEATHYIGDVPLYDDGEGRWLHDYIRRLREEAAT